MANASIMIEYIIAQIVGLARILLSNVLSASIMLLLILSDVVAISLLYSSLPINKSLDNPFISIVKLNSSFSGAYSSGLINKTASFSLFEVFYHVTLISWLALSSSIIVVDFPFQI